MATAHDAAAAAAADDDDDDRPERLRRALRSLDGLSVGDAFGEQFFVPGALANPQLVLSDTLPAGAFRYTDDTAMAIGIVEVLGRHGRIDQDDLAATFARHYAEERDRGYGGGAHLILMSIGAGRPWREVSNAVFSGMGSMGNGGAMRVGPLGAWFAEDDVSTIVEQASLSAEVTHAHPEGQAGAVAIALAASFAWRHRGQPDPGRPREMFEFVLAHTPPGRTRTGIEEAADLPPSAGVNDAAEILGNGSDVTAPDTVPFTLWCAARHLDSYPDAVWTAVRGGGDIDTNAAIVGGVVALSAAPGKGIPPQWLRLREALGTDLAARRDA